MKAYKYMGGGPVFHLPSDHSPDWSGCGRQLIQESEVDADEVPERVRCQYPGCEGEWPRYVDQGDLPYFRWPTGDTQMPRERYGRTCTCLGTCNGADRLGDGWVCALDTPP